MHRASGVLCHFTSLYSPVGIGDFGPVAFEFVDNLKRANQKYWQVLPIGNTDDSGCPYSTDSAFGVAEYYVSIENLISDYGLDRSFLNNVLDSDDQLSERVDFKSARLKKNLILKHVYEKAGERVLASCDFIKFAEEEKYWLEDYAKFRALKELRRGDFTEWDSFISVEENELARFHVFVQFVTLTQLKKLKEYAESNGIKLVGDLPIFVSYCSMDVWKHPQDFYLDEKNHMIYETGAAPDSYSQNGQKWGTPIYNWKQQKKNNYLWWQERLSFLARYFHVVRIDHFRGFCATWISRVNEENAKNGQWYPGPGIDLFSALSKTPELFAEDLGFITDDVIKLRDDLKLPSMKVLQFMSIEQENPHHPLHYKDYCVLYSGTHDNSTLMGWWNSLDGLQRSEYAKIIGLNIDPMSIDHWSLLRALFNFSSPLVIIPIQDLLGLGDEARFNIPGTVLELNWTWKLSEKKSKELNWTALCSLTNESHRGES